MNNTRLTHTITRRLRTAGVAAATTLALAAAAPAAHADVVVSGNHCTSFFYVDHVGSEACINRTNPSTSMVDLRVAAFDFARDGYSAYAEGRVLQYRYGTWVETNGWRSVTNSSGYGTTKLGNWFRVYRLSGATHIRMQLQSCSYDGARRVFRTCSGIVSSTKSWS